MKKLRTAFLVMLGTAVAATVAQANPYVIISADTVVDTVIGPSSPTTFTITATVYSDNTPGPGDFKYVYTVESQAASVKTFNIKGGVESSDTSLACTTAGFDSQTATANKVSFQKTTGGGSISLDNAVFSFLSPNTPELAGTLTGKQGSSSWTSGTDVYVPSGTPGGPVPDGGLTFASLGGALVGLGLMRRKFNA